jgi:ubiquinone/menaquinone biosynthesis C-methylase UbiE
MEPSTPLIQPNTSTTRTKSNYNRLACCYDSWASWEKPYIDSAFELLQIKPGQSVLDIGCATGALLNNMGKIVGKDGHIFGIDLSPAMCQIAKQRCESLPCQVDVICGDAVQILTNTNEMFDRISMTFTLELFDETDAIQLLKAAASKLVPGSGRMVIVSMSTAVEKAGCMMGCYACCRCVCPCVVDCKPIDLEAIVTKVKELAIVTRSILPMYGLAVEIIEVNIEVD